MNEFIHTEFFRTICIIISIIVGGYIVGRAFTKGFLKELDLFLGKKFTEYINNKKSKENDNEKKE